MNKLQHLKNIDNLVRNGINDFLSGQNKASDITVLI